MSTVSECQYEMYPSVFRYGTHTQGQVQYDTTRSIEALHPPTGIRKIHGKKSVRPASGCPYKFTTPVLG